MPLSDQLRTAFNDQIAMEFASMYAYLQMAAYFEATDMPGFAHWMRLQADEEREHAMKFYDFVLERGNEVELDDLAAPKAAFDSPLDVFESALAQEQAVTKSIHDLYDLASGNNDYASFPLLQWFVTEQVEEENTVGRIVERLRMAGDDATALLLLDRELGGRTAA